MRQPVCLCVTLGYRMLVSIPIHKNSISIESYRFIVAIFTPCLCLDRENTLWTNGHMIKIKTFALNIMKDLAAVGSKGF